VSRCGCQVKVQVHIDASSQRWYIKLFDDDHNHSFVKEKFERMLPTYRKMSEYDKYQMKTIRKSGISTTQIYGYFTSQTGGYENVSYTRRDMYNEQRTRHMCGNSDVEQALEFLKHMSSRDNMMFWRHMVNADGLL